MEGEWKGNYEVNTREQNELSSRWWLMVEMPIQAFFSTTDKRDAKVFHTSHYSDKLLVRVVISDK